MEMRAARMFGICGLLVAGLAGCNKVSKDNSLVLANVGGEQITQKAFEEVVRNYMGDPAKSQEILTSPAQREQRNAILGSLVNQKALMLMVKAEGLDKDPKVQIEMASATAGAYFQIMVERATTKAEPTEAQLKTFYDDELIRAKMAGQAASMPPYEQIKAQLPGAWKQKQGQVAREALLKSLNDKYPVIFAPDYKPGPPQ
jgi:hypothetical protein